MPTTLTTEQILALAPDPGAAKAGAGLANQRAWAGLGCDTRAVWGECQGSAREPYRTQIDLAEPAFRCSCPSRKFPCKHGLALLLLFARAPDLFELAAPPAAVAEWLAKRDQQAAASAAPAHEPAAPPKRAAQARTVAARDAKVAAGVAELARWLRDLVRRGLAEAQSQPASFWEGMAARLVDAQAPGLARRVRELALLPASGAGWQERMLAGLGRLHLLAESYPRITTLPEPLAADIRTAIGWPQQKEDLAQAPGLRDRWLVLGQRVEEDENLRTQRTWLWGRRSARPALVLSFAMFNQPLDRSLVPGAAIDAELVFFPSREPLRAIVRERFGPVAGLAGLPGAPGCAAALSVYAAALARQPWLERYPLALAEVTPELSGERWWLHDPAGGTLPLDARFAHGWRLRSLSGGRPLALFGEWDGAALLPLSAWAESEFYTL